MKKIAFVSGNMSHSGGTERVLSVVANGLADRGYPISVISFGGDGSSFFPLNPGISVHWLYEQNPMKHIGRTLGKYKAALRQEQPDVLVDVDIILCFYSILVRSCVPGMKWISWEHFNYFYRFPVNHNLRKLARRMVCRYSDQIIVLSEEDKGYYLKHCKISGRIDRIYNPTPFEDIPEIEKTEKMILAAGRLTPVKGFDLLLQSWSLLEKKYPDWKLVIAGEGEDRNALMMQKAEYELKNLELIGHVRNIESLYRKAAFFVLPSRYEGFVMVLLEAMAFSNPVVSYACKAGAREIVIQGENGFLVKPGQVREFADQMAVLMDDAELRAKMGRAARKSMDRFRTDRILDDWETLLSRI